MILFISFISMGKGNIAQIEEYHTFSIVVPFRNEAQNLADLIESLRLVIYPEDKFEVVFVDDHSTDNSHEIVENLISNNHSYKLIKATKVGKKAAIAEAVNKSKYNYIITIDADCTVKSELINSYNNLLSIRGYKFISGPVIFKGKSLLTNFLNFELLGLVGVGASTLNLGKPTIANGANLCFHRQTFLEVGGYEGNENIPSGDDEFLLKKIDQTYPDAIAFNKSIDSVVNTNPPNSFKNLFSQRLRWAGKWRNYSFLELFPQVFLTVLNFMIILSLFALDVEFSIKILLIKIVADVIFMIPVLKFYERFDLLIYGFFIQFFYPFYILLIAFLSLLRVENKWKGRVL